MKKKNDYNGNRLKISDRSLVMYVDMNSYFASCEQQLQAHLRGRPLGVCPYEGPNAVVIAASKEAKEKGIRTGMFFSECKLLCPEFEMVATRPVEYRRIHLKIMSILHKYCNEVIAKSIDEAVIDLSGYRYIYKDVMQLAADIKKDIAREVGECVTCSIGIAANTFLAKLGTEIQKPDGLVYITPENIDSYLKNMRLNDLPGIGSANERRLHNVGIYTPLQLRYASESLLRKVFGGVVGAYWHYRMHFMEVDLSTTAFRHMSAMRSLSQKTRASGRSLIAMLISLCTRLEQRLVKQDMFCKRLSFFTTYYRQPSWKSDIQLHRPIQDAMEMIEYILMRIEAFEKEQMGRKIICGDMQSMGVMIGDFISGDQVQYSLFDNHLQRDRLRKVVYGIKEKYGKNVVRKASETIDAGQMKDAIGFGSVKELYQTTSHTKVNHFLVEHDPEIE